MSTLTGGQPPFSFAQPNTVGVLIYRALPFTSGFGVVTYQSAPTQGVVPVRFWS